MARRSMSTEQQSHIQQLDIAELEESLNLFQRRVLDDHAETARWLLFDAKRSSRREGSRSADQEPDRSRRAA